MVFNNQIKLFVYILEHKNLKYIRVSIYYLILEYKLVEENNNEVPIRFFSKYTKQNHYGNYSLVTRMYAKKYYIHGIIRKHISFFYTACKS